MIMITCDIRGGGGGVGIEEGGRGGAEGLQATVKLQRTDYKPLWEKRTLSHKIPYLKIYVTFTETKLVRSMK